MPEKEDLIDLKTISKATPEQKEPVAPSALAKSPFEAAASALKSVMEKPNAGDVGEAAPVVRTITVPLNEQEYNGFNLVDMEKEIKFINCIEQLKTMGYSDDGGWLTRLVIAKDGNIHAVLDTLHPSKN